MMLGGTPASAREVAPPARMDWPAISDGKKQRNLLMNQECVGMVPHLCNLCKWAIASMADMSPLFD